MADEPQVPAQPEGAGPAKKKPAPVNLAMVEAAERGIDLNPTPAPKEDTKKAKAAEPPAAPAPEPTPAPAAEAEPEPAPEEPSAEEPRSERAPANEPAATGDTETSAVPTEALAQLAETASRKRLSPSDEDKATALLRGCLGSGETAAALAAMPKLPWILGVRAIEQAWPQLSPEAKTQLLDQLAALQGEHAIRLRLSVARSLAKIDPPVGIELAGAVCRAIWDTEKGALSTDHSKLIGNVFIGRGKPWIIQLPLEGLSAEHAQSVASAVVFSAFNVNNPPITQLSILRYAGARLGELHPNLLTMVARGVGRWSGKWQDSLRKEVTNLPEAIAGAMKSGRPGKQEAAAEAEKPAAEAGEGAPAAEHEEGELPLPPNLEEKLKLAVESGDAEAVEAVTLEVNAWRDAQAVAQKEAAEKAKAEEPAEEPERRGDKKRRGRDRDRDRDRDRNERSSDRKERPVYVSREQEAAAKTGGPFNLGNVLKQIESQFSQLRNELASTQAKLRKAESAPVRKSTDRVVLSVEEANLSPDELKRLVLQLERRNAELQTRVEELLADSETRALATSADADITVQYRTLLKLKLQEDYSDYLALEKNSPEFVVQQHYRAVIRHVFGVLRDEGVCLEGDLPPPPPEPLPPPPPPPVIEDEDEDEESALDQLDAEPDSEAAEAEAPEDEDAEDEVDGEADTAESESAEPATDSNGDDSGEEAPEGESEINGDHVPESADPESEAPTEEPNGKKPGNA